jgi:hypothetical protein
MWNRLNSPIFKEAFTLYDRWTTELVVYTTVFVLATGTALLLDLRLHMSPSTVLLYSIGLTVILMVVMPVSYRLLLKRHRSSSDRSSSAESVTIAADQWAKHLFSNYAKLLMATDVVPQEELQHQGAALQKRIEETLEQVMTNQFFAITSHRERLEHFAAVRREFRYIARSELAIKLVLETAPRLLRSFHHIDPLMKEKSSVFKEGYDEGYWLAIHACVHTLYLLHSDFDAEKIKLTTDETHHEVATFEQALQEIKEKIARQRRHGAESGRPSP